MKYFYTLLLFSTIINLSAAFSQVDQMGLNQDSLLDKDILIIRGFFIQDEESRENIGVLERVPQVRLMEEFIRAHRHNEISIIWIHTMRPEYSTNVQGQRIQKLLHYFVSREIPILGLHFKVIRSKKEPEFKAWGSPDQQVVIMISDQLKW